MAHLLTPGRGVRVTGIKGSGKTTLLKNVVERLERTGRQAYVIRALYTHRSIPYSAIGRLDLPARRGHPVIRLADSLTIQLTARRRSVVVIDDFHHVDAHSLAVLEDAFRRTEAPFITTSPQQVALSPEHATVLSTRSVTVIGIEPGKDSPPPPLADLPLTPRETEICALTGHLTNADIAEQLQISIRTVENHISNAMRKTGSSSRAALFKLFEMAVRI